LDFVFQSPDHPIANHPVGTCHPERLFTGAKDLALSFDFDFET